MSSTINKNQQKIQVNREDLEKIVKKMPKFELNEEEEYAYWTAFMKIHTINEHLIDHVQNLQDINDYQD